MRGNKRDGGNREATAPTVCHDESMPRRTRPSATDPTHEDNWHGTYYELAIKLGPADDVRLDAALKALWESARLGQPFRRGSGEDVEVSVAALLDGHLNAVATIPGLGSTLASVIVVREEVDEAGRSVLGNDWLDLCLPLGALGNLDGRVDACLFDDGTDPKAWREPIEEWFAFNAKAVFAAVPFVHAISGEEVSGVEPSEVREGRVGLWRRGVDGELITAPVSIWR